LGYFFSTVKVVYYLLQEMDWATFWATFSQTRSVTLLKSAEMMIE
jgi:hypothetical protein